MTDESPYVFDRSEGLLHVRLRSRPRECLGCIRLDVAEILINESKREAYAEAMAAARRVAQ